MRLGILFSGGKDSCLAMHKAMQTDEVACLITLESENPESYMFHTPNIHLTRLQAEALGLPLVTVRTKGEKEDELADLKRAISRAMEEQGIEGVVSGAINSVYQASRIQRICNELGVWCFNPLWQMKPHRVLRELLASGFEVIISGVFAYPFDRVWLGKKIDPETVKQLIKLEESYGINPAGEGGEFETLVLDGPMFRKRLVVKDYEIEYKNNVGRYVVKEAVLE